jgi:hypothetical protein
VHEVEPPAETQRRRGLEPMPPRLRVSAGDSLPKPILTAAEAVGGNRGAWTQQDLFVASWLRVMKKQRLVRRSRKSGSWECLTRGHEDTKKAGAWVLEKGSSHPLRRRVGMQPVATHLLVDREHPPSVRGDLGRGHEARVSRFSVHGSGRGSAGVGSNVLARSASPSLPLQWNRPGLATTTRWMTAAAMRPNRACWRGWPWRKAMRPELRPHLVATKPGPFVACTPWCMRATGGRRWTHQTQVEGLGHVPRPGTRRRSSQPRPTSGTTSAARLPGSHGWTFHGSSRS